jgi:hypothetical protein
MDPVWLKTIWEDGGSTRVEMIEILISLALLKLKSKLWSVDILWTMLIVVYFGLYLFSCWWFDDQYIWWLFMILWRCSTLSLILFCDVLLLSLNPIALVKSSVIVFSLWREKWFHGGCVLEGYGWDAAPWDQLLVNWFIHRAGCHNQGVARPLASRQIGVVEPPLGAYSHPKFFSLFFFFKYIFLKK